MFLTKSIFWTYLVNYTFHQESSYLTLIFSTGSARNQNGETVTTTYYYHPTTNKSATVRVRKANFLKSPYIHQSQKRGFTFGGKSSDAGSMSGMITITKATLP